MKTLVTKLAGSYALVKWEKKYSTEWVIAWGYDDTTGTWGQGHYFYSFKDAIIYAQEQEIL